MEIELKYTISKDEILDKIWTDEEISQLEITNSRKEKLFTTVYFDTKDYRLMKEKIALRIRYTGEKTIATLKNLVKGQGHIHKREEIEVEIDGMPQVVDVGIFQTGKLGLDLAKITGNMELVSIMETKFKRKAIILEYGKAQIELALDKGKVSAAGKEKSICEMELELINGPESDLLRLGEQIVGKYKLKPEEKSKYQRGLQLLDMC